MLAGARQSLSPSVATEADGRQPRLTNYAAAVDGATTPLERLTALRALLDAADQVARETVAAARRSRASWQQVGQALAVSKQAAQKRFQPRLVFDVELGPLEREAGVAYLQDVDVDRSQVLEVGTRVELRDEGGHPHPATVEAIEPSERGRSYRLRIEHREPRKPAEYVITTPRGHRALFRIRKAQ